MDRTEARRTHVFDVEALTDREVPAWVLQLELETRFMERELRAGPGVWTSLWRWMVR